MSGGVSRSVMHTDTDCMPTVVTDGRPSECDRHCLLQFRFRPPLRLVPLYTIFCNFSQLLDLISLRLRKGLCCIPICPTQNREKMPSNSKSPMRVLFSPVRFRHKFVYPHTVTQHTHTHSTHIIVHSSHRRSRSCLSSRHATTSYSR